MAETEKKISELTTASQINDTDLTILSQGSSGSGFASVKATILAIANKIVSGINFTSALQTTNKTITGAINEVAQGGGGGSSTLSGLSDVDIDTLTLDDGQGLVYDETEGKWVNGSASGGGHTIVDNSGISLAQEPKLKLNGMYVHDDSANQTTVGEYYREMTTAQYNQLSAAEKQGMIRLTDNNYIGEADDILYESDGQGNDVTVGDKLDSIVEGHTIKNDSGTSLTQRDTLQATGVYAHDDSTNSKTVIEVVREFNSVSDIENLTGEEAKGFQYLDDDVYDEFTAGDIGFDNSDTSFVGTNVQDVLEEVDTSLKAKASKGWTYIGEGDNTAVNISSYSEILLCMKNTSNNMIINSTVAPVSVALSVIVNVYLHDGTNMLWVRIDDNGTKLKSGQATAIPVLYAR